MAQPFSKLSANRKRNSLHAILPSRPGRGEESSSERAGRRKLSSSGEEWFPTTYQPATSRRWRGSHRIPSHTGRVIFRPYLPYLHSLQCIPTIPGWNDSHEKKNGFPSVFLPTQVRLSSFLPSWTGLFLLTDFLPHSHYITNQFSLLFSRRASLLQGRITFHTGGQSGVICNVLLL